MKIKLFSTSLALVLGLTLGLASSGEAWAKCHKCPEKVSCPQVCPVERPVACPQQCPEREVSCPKCPEKRCCPNLKPTKPCRDRCGCPTGSNLNTSCLPPTGAPAVYTSQNDSGSRTVFRVVNPSASPTRFQVASVGINEVVPAASERTFYLDMSGVQACNVAYSLQCSNGTVVASGNIPNALFTERNACLAVDLSHIINYSTAYSYPIEPEPQYRERPVSYKKPVRGYW